MLRAPGPEDDEGKEGGTALVAFEGVGHAYEADGCPVVRDLALDVAHRLSAVRGADRSVVVGEGRSQEVGTRGELVRRGGACTALHGGRVA